MKGLYLLLATILTIGVASAQLDLSINAFASDMKKFTDSLYPELISLAFAAIISIALRGALKKGGFPENSLGAMTVALTMGIFLVIYVTDAYMLFAPFVAYISISAIGYITFILRKAIKEMAPESKDMDGWADLVAAAGCFIMMLFALAISGDQSQGFIIALVLLIMGILFAIKGFMEMSEAMGDLSKSRAEKNKDKNTVETQDVSSGSKESSNVTEENLPQAKQTLSTDFTEAAKELKAAAEGINELFTAMETDLGGTP